MAPSVTIAQLCQELTEIEDATSHHIFELFTEVEVNKFYPFAQTGIRRKITLEIFKALFYPDGGGSFRIRDCSDEQLDILILNNWKVLDYPFVNPIGSSDISYNSADLLTLVPQQWTLDLSHNNTCCWTVCSYMSILKELLCARNLCNWECKVCCALTTQEIADILNQQDPLELDERRTATNPLRAGDEFTLSLLFTNPNPLAKPIELHLQFFMA